MEAVVIGKGKSGKAAAELLKHEGYRVIFTMIKSLVKFQNFRISLLSLREFLLIISWFLFTERKMLKLLVKLNWRTAMPREELFL